MALENAMAFGVNEALKRAFPDDPADPSNSSSKVGPPSLGKPFLMGAITGCCSALVLLPSEVIKAKTQVVVGENISSQDIMKRMIKESGYKVRPSFFDVSSKKTFISHTTPKKSKLKIFDGNP